MVFHSLYLSNKLYWNNLTPVQLTKTPDLGSIESQLLTAYKLIRPKPRLFL